MSTVSHYDAILTEARKKFTEECSSHECAWRVLRIESVVDSLHLRIRKAKILNDKKSFSNIKDELLGIINYCIIGLVQLKDDSSTTTKSDITVDEALALYDHHMKNARGYIFGSKFIAQKITGLNITIWIFSIENIIEQAKFSLKLPMRNSRISKKLMEIINYAAFALENVE